MEKKKVRVAIIFDPKNPFDAEILPHITQAREAGSTMAGWVKKALYDHLNGKRPQPDPSLTTPQKEQEHNEEPPEQQVDLTPEQKKELDRKISGLANW